MGLLRIAVFTAVVLFQGAARGDSVALPPIPDVIDPSEFPPCSSVPASTKREKPCERYPVQCMHEGHLVSYFDWYFSTQDGGVKKMCDKVGGSYGKPGGSRDECTFFWSVSGHAVKKLETACWTGCEPKYGYCQMKRKTSSNPDQNGYEVFCSVDRRSTGKNRWTHLCGQLHVE